MFLRRVSGEKSRDVMTSDRDLISALIYKHTAVVFNARTEVAPGTKYSPSETSCLVAADSILELVYGLKSSGGPDLEERVSRLEKWAKGEIGALP
ncbi:MULTISPECIES: hypothetical protein [Mycobacteroides]|uniref:hypothetical protein n=1 Tax=Mycobacteroides TaxID=670516 RepID=UPI000925C785|nr:hypothetical protein [Mycobacteroides abscessus]SHT24777.1 Uncharacterised protein [Mycobacteroides abscessus subsp. abscessus]SHW68617.1 Uncharacterised protein [Mycobacteroides abscessus subsp. abscessus]SHY70300.1 Uncharacterised protein [Mycobacteroides abscessus subsp. abscessus]SHZ44907.1 Uncharacterised protein [Mycobacteroides abscessus subsp. abscessus]SKR90606.1 Uncharacterised protein [Mycobacteroides abscessus subsp. abscessus]